MPRRKTFGKAKFRGNQHKSMLSENACSSDVPENQSTSKKKLLTNEIEVSSDDVSTDLNNIIIQVGILSALLKQSVKCKHCNNVNCMVAEEEFTSRKGLAVNLKLRCTVCGNSASAMSSQMSDGSYDINYRLTYAMRCIGKGLNAARTLCAVMNLPPPPIFTSLSEKLLTGLTHVSTESMLKATEETVTLGDEGRDITAAFDGTWQKRGHTSLNGVVSVTSLENGKVLDFECLSKFCNICKGVTSASQPHICKKNYEGFSGGMESAGVVQIFKRSLSSRNIRYVNYLGDGDSKAYETVKNVYGADVSIEKLECIGHVQKRMGTRLRNLKKSLSSKKLSDGKSISGRGRLTDKEILLIQQYYGLAIRRNVNKTVPEMVKSIWAIYFHKLSTDTVPQHGLCPSDDDTWCGYHKALKDGKSYSHSHSLPEAVMTAMKPIFRALTSTKLLEKCLHGKTQNPNESFNSCIWQRLPKTSFTGLNTLKLGVMDAVCCFNDGALKRVEVLKYLGIKPGGYMVEGLKKIDNMRMMKAEIAVQNASKEARKLQRIKKRKSDHAECLDKTEYGAGEF